MLFDALFGRSHAFPSSFLPWPFLQSLFDPPQDGDTVLVRSGPSVFYSAADLSTVVGLGGPQTVLLSGTVETISLGRGEDTLVAAETDFVSMGNGRDYAFLSGPAEVVELGRGRDILKASDFIDVLDAGHGRDAVTLEGGAGSVSLGKGADRLVTDGAIEMLEAGRGSDEIVFRTEGALFDELALAEGGADRAAGQGRMIDGGAGDDALTIADSLGAFDFTPIDGGVILADRFTGEEMVVTGVETFTFDTRTLTLEELTELFSGTSPNIFASGGTQNVSVNDADPSVSVMWNRAAIQSVIDTEGFGPTTASRAYAMVHTAIFDAFAAIDPTAIRISPDSNGNNAALEAEITAAMLTDPEGLQEAAMNFAAYVVLGDLFPEQEPLHRSILEERYGLGADDTTSLAARIGRDAAADLLEVRRTDGSNQENGYADTTNYQPVNTSPFDIADITRWTPENRPIDPETDTPDQTFLTPHWGLVEGFALTPKAGVPTTSAETYLAEALTEVTSLYTDQDAAPEPFFTDAFADATLNFDPIAGAYTGTITLNSAATIDGTAFAAGSEIDVSKDLIGEVINPNFISQAEVVLDYSANLDGNDEGLVSAEFYEDGPGTGFPPGTSMTFAEWVSADRDTTLAEDALLFASVANAVFDAGIATWEAKTFYDYVRPVRAIRDLGELGLIGEMGVDYKGDTGYVVEAYVGPEIGTALVLAEEWETYQLPGGDPSPPFAEFTSGHSAFSAAGAAALRAFSDGDDTFGGSVFFPAGSTIFEPGVSPAEDYMIEWATFTEAADEAGLSRLWGGIHFEEGDFHSRALGQYLGDNAFDLMESYFDGTFV